MEEIIIWDDSARRINEMEKELKKALHDLGMKGNITSNSEAPLLSRMQLYGTTPAVEIGGEYWRMTPGKAIDYSQFIQLLTMLKEKRKFKG